MYLDMILWYRPPSSRVCAKPNQYFLKSSAHSLPGGFYPRGLMSRGQVSGGFCPGGLCPGGLCPRISNVMYLDMMLWYRPPSSSKSIFLEKFGPLLAIMGTDAADRPMICGDFILPGISSSKINLLNLTCFTQHIDASTRHDSHHTRSSLLDLIINPSTSKFVPTTSVVCSHEIADHDLALANLTIKRYRPPPPRDHINITT